MAGNINLSNSELDRELNNELSEDSEIEESDNESVLSFVDDPNDLSDYELPDIFQDDTDEDPTYFPDNDPNIDPRSSPDVMRGRPSIRGRARGQGRVRQSNLNRGLGRQNTRLDRTVLSSSESEDEEENNQTQYKWEKVNENSNTNFTHTFSYSEIPGPKHCPPVTAKPIDYFNLFFTQTLLTMFVSETNRYATQTLSERGANISPRSRLLAWVPTSVKEIKAFIIVLANMGLIRKPTIKSYWSGTFSQSTAWFARMFTRDRFESLLSFFHMVDNSKLPKANSPDYDPCQKFQPLQDHCNRLFNFHYNAHEQLSIDESLIGTKSQTQLMQYLPNKHHHRWGVKLWVLCDSVSNYCLSFFCYKGKHSTEDKIEIKNKGLAYVVVNKLLTFCNYLKKGFHVFTDNFYTSLHLLDYLYSNETFMTGTVRRNRKHLPKEVKEKINVGQKVYCKLDGKPFVALAYRQKKSQKQPVILLSSKPEIKDEDVTKRRRGRITTETKPSIVKNYCQYMGGIDTFDMMMYTYLDERRSMKYWRKVAFNLFSRMILNAYVIYKENCTTHNLKPMNRYAFVVSIIESVTEEWLGEQQQNENRSANRPIGLVALPGNQQKTCWVCTPKGKDYKNSRKRSRLVCSRCNEGCHGTCMAKHICK